MRRNEALQVLGLPVPAQGEGKPSYQEIRKAFHQAALRWHPDKNPDDLAHAQAQFQQLAAAYARLSRPDLFGKEAGDYDLGSGQACEVLSEEFYAEAFSSSHMSAFDLLFLQSRLQRGSAPADSSSARTQSADNTCWSDVGKQDEVWQCIVARVRRKRRGKLLAAAYDGTTEQKWSLLYQLFAEVTAVAPVKASDDPGKLGSSSAAGGDKAVAAGQGRDGSMHTQPETDEIADRLLWRARLCKWGRRLAFVWVVAMLVASV